MKPDAVQFTIGSRVFFALDDSKSGIVTAVLFRADAIRYAVTWCDFTERWHEEVELTKERTFKTTQISS